MLTWRMNHDPASTMCEPRLVRWCSSLALGIDPANWLAKAYRTAQDKDGREALQRDK
jgi:hypothetical protein